MPATEALGQYRIPITGTLNSSGSSDSMTGTAFEIVKSQSGVGPDKFVSGRIPHMPDGDKLEIKVPIPWSSEPVGLVFSGWRCIMFLIAVVAVATVVLAMLR